jgi:cysteine desulfurase
VIARHAPAGATLDSVAVYLDHAAGGPMHPDAVAAMVAWMTSGFGNPSGAHQVARRARQAIDEAREEIASLVGFTPGGIVFTSGGTEADNLALLGASPSRPGAIVLSAVEHPAVLEAARRSGRELRVLGVDSDGKVGLDQLGAVLDPDVAIVSVQLANHETGVVQDLDAIARRVRKRSPGALVHTDAVQAAPWMDLRSAAACADLVSISGHKFGGPQGVGVLAVRPGAEISAIIHGGGQERRRRSGTHNVAGALGMAAALRARSERRAETAATVAGLRTHNVAGALGMAAALRARSERRAETAATVAGLRNRLCESVLGAVSSAVATALDSPRVPGHCHLRFPGVEAESLLFLLDEAGVCASAGAACASGAFEPSPVLMAMGVSRDEAGSCLRLTLGPDTTEADVDFAAQAVVESARRLGGPPGARTPASVGTPPGARAPEGTRTPAGLKALTRR